MKRWLIVLAVYAIAALGAAAGLWGADHAVQQDQLEGRPPGEAGWLGTDHLGRDVWARTLQGSRVAVSVGALAAGLAVLCGAALGLLAGWFRGGVDAVATWVSGAVAAVPGILLILALGSMLGRGFATVFLTIGLVTWVGIFRIVRAEVLRLRESEFIVAARASGARHARVLWRHLLPNLAPILLIQFSLYFVFAVKTEVVVSFLGVGMDDEPSWGMMIRHAQSDLANGRWWPLAAATVAMFGLVLAVQALADRLRDRLDPSLSGGAGATRVREPGRESPR